MKIWLDELTTRPMWFLGEPKAIKVSLTCQDPGPVEISLDKLTKTELSHLIRAVGDQVVKIDIPISELQNKITPPSPPPVPSSALPTTDLVKEITEKIVEKRDRITSRCLNLLKQPLNIIRSEIKKEKESRVLVRMVELESEGKNRPVVLELIRTRRERLDKQLLLNINKGTKKTKKKVTTKPDVIEFDVEESETVEVVLTPDDISRLAEGRSL